ncbi:spore coat protein [Paenibacillus sp. M1]|uniref:Spore coat protein n=1 Tax=Paenibacillus haidiansis TaxID=1574488 RepID=A0ABU7VPE0_9BACL
MELHELVAFQANNLMGFKMQLPDVKDPQLHALYVETIQGLEQNLKDLLQFYPSAPHPARGGSKGDMTGFYAGHLLGFAKTAVRSYAIAITETSTPQLRDTFQKQLNNAIKLHAKIFNFMLERGLYPSYNLDKLLATDVQNANMALNM